MAVFSKFAVSAVAVAVGYGEERCETVSALRVELSHNLVNNSVAIKGLDNVSGPESRVVMNQDALKKVLQPKEHAGYNKKAIGFKEFPKTKLDRLVTPPTSPTITMEMIIKMEKLDKASVNEVLDKIGCKDAEKKKMLKLLHYLSKSEEEVKKKFFHAATQFKQKFGELVEGKCALNDAIRQLLKDPTVTKKAIELLEKNSALVKEARMNEIQPSTQEGIWYWSKGALFEKGSSIGAYGVIAIVVVVALLGLFVTCAARWDGDSSDDDE